MCMSVCRGGGSSSYNSAVLLHVNVCVCVCVGGGGGSSPCKSAVLLGVNVCGHLVRVQYFWV